MPDPAARNVSALSGSGRHELMLVVRQRIAIVFPRPRLCRAEIACPATAIPDNIELLGLLLSDHLYMYVRCVFQFVDQPLGFWR